MRRRLVIIVSAVLFVASVGSVVLGAHAANASSQRQTRKAPDADQFVGYWMGIDPLDGGDSRRAITRSGDRFPLVGRDTVFTLCDDTDRAIVTGDGVIVGSELHVDNVLITCFGNGAILELTVRYEPLDENILRETVTTRDGDPVDVILFHRVSEQ
jgi:hypothetical protein